MSLGCPSLSEQSPSTDIVLQVLQLHARAQQQCTHLPTRLAALDAVLRSDPSAPSVLRRNLLVLPPSLSLLPAVSICMQKTLEPAHVTLLAHTCNQPSKPASATAEEEYQLEVSQSWWVILTQSHLPSISGTVTVLSAVRYAVTVCPIALSDVPFAPCRCCCSRSWQCCIPLAFLPYFWPVQTQSTHLHTLVNVLNMNCSRKPFIQIRMCRHGCVDMDV